MKINRQLHLVIPIDRDDGSQIFVHSTPISTDVYKQYRLLAYQTMNALYTKGIGVFAPRAACDMLREVSQENAGPDPQSRAHHAENVERFLAEIRRMTNVFAPIKTGWEMVPLDDAASTGVIDAEEADEIDGALVFFTCGSKAHRKAEQGQVSGALSLWGARTELLSCTEFRASLPTLTATASSGAKAQDSSPMPLNG